MEPCQRASIHILMGGFNLVPNSRLSILIS
jgi:hypothetical protein